MVGLRDLVLLQLVVTSFALGADNEIGRRHRATITVELADIGMSSVYVSANDNIPEMAATFCRENDISHPRCPHFVAVDMWDALWCRPGQKSAAKALGLDPPRTFRFLHHAFHADSDEFSLLRPRLRSNGFVECSAGLTLSGEEDAVWMLGHLSSRDGDSSRWIYEPLAAADGEGSKGRFLVNQFPDAGHLGNKDEMTANLVQLGRLIGDAAIDFIPRTWSPLMLNAEERAPLNGVWVQKDPQKELGSGISLVSGVNWETLAQCEQCVLQRYVENPHLLNGKKYSFGVYTAFTGVDPLSVWIHREMLVLVCTRDYVRDDTSDPLRHLSNGLLNRRLNADEVPECDGCEYNATEQVWTTDRFLDYLARDGLEWGPIERQLRRIILTSFSAAMEKFVKDVRNEVPNGKMREEIFSHWRFDFLLGATGKVWLLETEIVPSAGTIGGVDEVIKTVVFRDLLSLIGWGPEASEHSAVSKDEGCSTSTAPTYDQQLCSQQPLGSWSRKLCVERICRRVDGYNAGTTGLRQEVEFTLENVGDLLWLDSESVSKIVTHEARSRRRLGYEPLVPIASEVLLGDRAGSSYVAFDGSPGVSDAALVEAERFFLSSRALPSDQSLWRWEAAKARAQERRNTSKALRVARRESNYFGFMWESLPALSSYDAYSDCSRCFDASEQFAYCASIAGAFASITGTLQPSLRGACVASWDQCRDVPTGFLDGIQLSSREECDLLSGSDENITTLLWRSKAFNVHRFQPLVQQQCELLTSGKDYSDAWLEICSAFSFAVKHYSERTPQVISLAEFEHLGGLSVLHHRNKPVIIRDKGTLSSADLQMWEPDAMKAAFTGLLVTAIVYDSSKDAAQDMFTSSLAFHDFVDWARDPSQFVIEGQSTRGAALVLYLLLTTRHVLEGLPGAAEGIVSNPNAELMSRDDKMNDLITTAGNYFVPANEGWREAWTSLRLGGKYKYPTHIDCFENMILQLHGEKIVHLIPPNAVGVVQPDPSRKHWPMAKDAELADLRSEVGWVAHLYPGDQLYVPLMWFHSVEVLDGNWSVTANRYFYHNGCAENECERSDTSQADWGHQIRQKKTVEWLKYEESNGLSLC